MKKYTTEQFIEKTKKIHNDKYDYSLSDYRGSQIKLKIICKDHGVFEQKPNAHLNGQGCSKCSKYGKNDIFEFIKKAKIIHNNKYDYSLVDYKNSHEKIKIICHIHGVFEQQPCNHINQHQGCPSCYGNKKSSNEEFINKSNEKHGNKYDYSLVNYINEKEKIKIICSIHGEFYQKPEIHIKGSGCPQCSIHKSRKIEKFINQSKLKYNNKYDYSLVNYKRCDKKIRIICPIHGLFEQIPVLHLKRGCPICEGNMKLNTEQIIFIFKKVHENTYDYSLVEYINNKTKVDIICKKHGIFKQTPGFHKSGGGCPKCRESKGERKIRKILKNKNISFISQKKFPNCKDQNDLLFDFYLPNINTCIEFDGKQHFESNSFFGGDERLKKQKIKDEIKNNFCKENNIKLIRIKYNENINDKLLSIISL